MNDKENLLALITDDDFGKLQSKLNRLNIFKITGMGTREIKHSNTIAWFLNPSENHSLGSLFSKRFIYRLFETNQDYFNNRNVNILELMISDLDDLEVIREQENNIDILIKSRNHNFILCIENKVWSGLSDEQLDKYHKYITKKYVSYNKIFVYLSPCGYEVPVDKSENPDEWISSSYSNIVNILRSILKLDIEQKIRYIISDYIDLLEMERIVENPELNHLLKNLYEKHNDAINLLFEYHNGRLVRIRDIIVGILGKLKEKCNIYCNDVSLKTSWLMFYTDTMDKYLKRDEHIPSSWQDGTKYCYAIWINLGEEPRIVLQLGMQGQEQPTIEKFNKIKIPGSPEITDKEIYRIIKKWPLDFKWSDADVGGDVNSIQGKIDNTLKEIFEWEKEATLNV
jgi:hypothetical protein